MDVMRATLHSYTAAPFQFFFLLLGSDDVAAEDALDCPCVFMGQRALRIFFVPLFSSDVV